MKQQPPEILRERDILGLEKPTNQLKPSRMKSDAGFLVISLIILMVVAVVVYVLN